MISRDSIRSILVDCAASGITADAGFDSALVMDSFTLVWLKHELEERHGLVINPDWADLATFTSVDGIHDYLATVVPHRVTTPGEPT